MPNCPIINITLDQLFTKQNYLTKATTPNMIKKSALVNQLIDSTINLFKAVN